MGEAANRLLEKLYGTSPYRDFPCGDYALDLQGGLEQPQVTRLIAELRPKVIFEVGSWKGDSAIRMAKLVQKQDNDAVILCIDTWLGSIEHWLGSIPGWDIRSHLRYGYPNLYYQFLANVMDSQVEDVIVPVPNTSANAAKWLARQRILADLIYLDASHEEDDVYQDLCNYWRLLRVGGVLCGDDWETYWYGVICAVNRFVREHELDLQISGRTWVIRKRR